MIGASDRLDRRKANDADPTHPLEVYIAERVLCDICDHARTTGRRDGVEYEVMGLLVGDVYRWAESTYAVVDGSVTGRRDRTPRVRFTMEDLVALSRQLAALDDEYLIIGWYHTHPGFPPTPSGVDIRTQRRMFAQPYQCMLILDTQYMRLGVYTLANGGCRKMRSGVCRGGRVKGKG